jgi:acetylglutamate kinase
MLAKAETLIEALPYLQRYAGRTFVVKYGGHAMGDPELARDFAEDVVLLKAIGINPVVVHGGGPQIGAMLKKLGVESQFIDGLRVTDKVTAQVAEMVLSGAINKELVAWISAAGGKAIGISGKDGNMVTASKVTRTRKDPDSNIEQVIDLGFVGEPTKIDPHIIQALLTSETDYIPVIAPIGVSTEGETFNINADTVAGALAGALKAKRMLMLTDIKGVLDANGELIRQMTLEEARALIDTGVATGGMIPKLENAIHAVESGVEAVVILDGRRPHAMLVELFSEHGAGTLISR